MTIITFDPQVMGGNPSIRGIRVTVGTLVWLIAAGHSFAEILKAYPYLEDDDFREALIVVDEARTRVRTLPLQRRN